MDKEKQSRPASAAGDRALSPQDVTDYLAVRKVKISVFTVKRLIAAGEIPSLRIGSRDWTFEGDLVSWLQQGGSRRRHRKVRPRVASA